MLLRRNRHGLTSAAAAAASFSSSCVRPFQSFPSPSPTFLKKSYELDCRLRLRRYSVATARASSDPTYNIAVVGGGISGLASAYYLLKEVPGAKITVYEASEQLGGWLRSPHVPVRDGNVLFEGALRTFRPNHNGKLAAQMVQELDLIKETIFTPKTAPAALNRYVYYPDRLVRMPHPSFGIVPNLYNFFTEPIFANSLRGFFREAQTVVRDASVKDESVGDFMARRFHPDMVDRILSAVIHGIYAGDVYQLSARSLFSRLWWDELDSGSIILGALAGHSRGTPMTNRDAQFLKTMSEFSWDKDFGNIMNQTSVFTFKEGSQMLVDRLVEHLRRSGSVQFKTNTKVEAWTTTEQGGNVLTTSGNSPHTHLVSALSPAHLAKVVSGFNSLPGGTIPAVTVMTVNLYFKTPGMHPPGFGYLIPQATSFEKNPERALGVVFDTAYSPEPYEGSSVKDNGEFPGQLTPDGFMSLNSSGSVAQDDVPSRGTKVTVMLGGHWWDKWPAYPDEKEGLALARSLLQRHLGITEEPEAWRVNLQKDCIPQYTVGHEDRLKQMHNELWRKFKGRVRVTGNWICGVGANDCLRSAYEMARSFQKQGTGLEAVGEAIDVRVKTTVAR